MDKLLKYLSDLVFDPSESKEVCIDRAEKIKLELEKMILALRKSK